MVFEDWGVEFGKMEACLARLEASLATPVEKPGISLNKSPADARIFRRSVPATPSSIYLIIQRPRPEMGYIVALKGWHADALKLDSGLRADW